MRAVPPSPILIAKIAFHEAMHNKVVRDVHNLGGGGLSSRAISEGTAMTDIDKGAMAEVLGRDRPQWTNGCRDHSQVIIPRNQPVPILGRDLD